MATKKLFEVTFHIAGDKLTTITELVAGECTLVSMHEIKGTPRKAFRYFGGKRRKGITGAALALGILNENQQSRPVIAIEVFEAAFKAHGFAPNSCRATLSHLVNAGTVKRVAMDRFALAETTTVRR